MAQIPIPRRDRTAIINESPDLRQVPRVVLELHIALSASDQRRKGITVVVHHKERDPGAPELAILKRQKVCPEGFDIDDLSPRGVPAQISPGSQLRSAAGFVARIVVATNLQMNLILELGQGQRRMFLAVVIALLRS